MSFKAFSAPVLEFRGLVKRFGGNCAVNDVSFELCPGEILALLGQNGAGKSTLIKLLAGIHAPSSGEILLNNEPTGNKGNFEQESLKPPIRASWPFYDGVE